MILEVNSKVVTSPEGLQGEIAKARDNLQLKVGSPTQDKPIFSGRQVNAASKTRSLSRLRHNTKTPSTSASDPNISSRVGGPQKKRVMPNSSSTSAFFEGQRRIVSVL